ncbi:amidohydrolase [Mesobacillus campisalis]|uniref:Amidohydrolase n=1 Tax=Mesobacillus campisalis TaxID=1408103 RepID=A0A0M2SY46_9BACI|nr:amidohydrolase [Mesobacillus campisalis]KKK37892.1 amidohydrolase [Mesobacillus campisalis]
MDLFQYIDKKQDTILKTYHELHGLAEPSWEEEKTSRYLQEKLQDAGLEVKTYTGHHGFTAEWKGELSEVIALRADMDALVQEVGGVVRPNHSCGHDAHSTMVLMAALALAKSMRRLRHTVRFIFQPAEEKAEGALKMLEDGALENVRFLAGIHLRPKSEVSFGKAAPVILHGSTASLKGTIKGVPAHAARPEEGNNPLEAAALLIQEVKNISIVDKGRYSIKITELHGGEASNSIPASARFTFDMRSEKNEAMESLIERANEAIRKTEVATGVTIESGISEYSPAAVQNQAAIQLAQTAIAEILGRNNVSEACVTPGAEDFHFYTVKKPHLAATMVGLGCGLAPGLHHPDMSFNEGALVYGAKILAKMLLLADKKKWSEGE